jgi:hypothetical protein
MPPIPPLGILADSTEGRGGKVYEKREDKRNVAEKVQANK